MLSFFPRAVLDEILNLIESVSEGFPTYTSDEESFLNSPGSEVIKLFSCSTQQSMILFCS